MTASTLYQRLGTLKCDINEDGMQINANFNQRVLVHSDNEPWLASPMPGVEQHMLDCMGGEVARATTIVRYASNSHFSKHSHTGGEEFIVLDGIFQDEHGDYPAGAYVRNPPTTSHSPRSDQGCIIFVKLWQFDMQDRNQFHLTMPKAAATTQGGIKTAVLHQDTRETVKYIEAEAGAKLVLDANGGVEMLVLSGTLTESGDALRQGSWLRCPSEVTITTIVGENGAKIWVKSGHLPYAKAPMV